MANASPKEIQKVFEMNNNRFKNSGGMELGCSGEAGIWTYLTVTNYERSPLKVGIYTVDEDITDFIEGFNLRNIEDLHRLTYASSWTRYRKGDAEIIVSPRGLEADLSFRIHGRKTIVFSMDLHFYDEVSEHLTMPEDFAEYLLENERKLYEVNTNRYRIKRA